MNIPHPPDLPTPTTRQLLNRADLAWYTTETHQLTDLDAYPPGLTRFLRADVPMPRQAADCIEQYLVQDLGYPEYAAHYDGWVYQLMPLSTLGPRDKALLRPGHFYIGTCPGHPGAPVCTDPPAADMQVWAPTKGRHVRLPAPHYTVLGSAAPRPSSCQYVYIGSVDHG